MIPNFVEAGDEWWWLSFLGWCSVRDITLEEGPCRPIPGYYLLNGKSPRGVSHIVVAREVVIDGYVTDEIVHDPHPSRAGLRTPGARYRLTRKLSPQGEEHTE